ncbi:MAG: CapA family protein [Oscillospiraceae bacterium]|nr:CapA family protein [Oscillospiraceae bacterium]
MSRTSGTTMNKAAFGFITLFLLLCFSVGCTLPGSAPSATPEATEPTPTVSVIVITPTPISTPTPEPTPEPTPTPIPELVVNFAGDCTFSDISMQKNQYSFSTVYDREGPDYFFAKVKRFFETDDLTVVNLEGPLSDLPPSVPDKEWWFKGRAEFVKVLTGSSVEAVSLANNHTMDAGKAVFEDTKKNLDDAGVLWSDYTQRVYFSKDGISVSVYCDHIGDALGANEKNRLLEHIKEAQKDSDFIMFYLHGGAESLTKPEPWRVKLSEELVDAGADVVIWSHAHRLQPLEAYGQGYIHYGLSNFSFGGAKRPPRETVIFQLRMTKTGGEKTISAIEIPCWQYPEGEYSTYQPFPAGEVPNVDGKIDVVA